MKKIVVLFVSMLVLATTASAGNDKPIQVSQLPQTAQQFIKKYFGDRKVAFAKEESDFRKSYEIAFKNGDKIEFDRKGEWTDIDCKYSAVPTGIIPAPVSYTHLDVYKRQPCRPKGRAHPSSPSEYIRSP